MILIHVKNNETEQTVWINKDILPDYEEMGFKPTGDEKEEYVEGYDPPEEKAKIEKKNSKS